MTQTTKKVLLALLPYWTPQIPPMGISCLKSYLSSKGFDVVTFDLNVNPLFRKFYDEYFNEIRKFCKVHQSGGFYNIGHDVLQNHMMAFLNKTSDQRYYELIGIVIQKTFYYEAPLNHIVILDKVLESYFTELKSFIQNIIEKENPDVFGLSVYKGNLPSAMVSFQIAKTVSPHIMTVMGGAVFAQTLIENTPNFNHFLNITEDYIDKLVIGEGELIFERLLNGLLPEDQRYFSIKDVENCLLSLNSFYIPDFSGLNLDFYPSLSAFTSRSCPFQCSFCTETVYWGKYRKKSVDQILAELNSLYKKYGNQLYLMCDSLLNPVINKLSEQIYESDNAIYWDGYLKVDKFVCDPEYVLKWRRGGFYRARLGIESGSLRVLNSMHKNITIDQIKNSLKSLSEAGIKTTTYWIIGYPEETDEDFEMTLQLIEEMSDYIYEAHGNPFGYYMSGQVDSDFWLNKYVPKLLYPEWAKDMLIVDTYQLDCKPSREKTYERLHIFEEHCAKLGIANPYSLYDIHNADKRWKQLHKNAVPSLVEFKKKETIIDECKKVRSLTFAAKIIDEGDFNF